MSDPASGIAGESRLDDAAWLVALDVDGTTIHEDETLDLAVIEAVHRARARGHEVTLATGRSWHTTEPILRALGITPEYVVCANGAVIMRRMGDVFEGEGEPDYVRAHVETFDPSAVLVHIRTSLPDGRFMVELPDTTRLYTEGMVDWDLTNAREVPFGELLGQEATRVVVVSPDHEIDDFLAIVEGMGLHQVSYAVGWTSWLNIITLATSQHSAPRPYASRPSSSLSSASGADLRSMGWTAREGATALIRTLSSAASSAEQRVRAMTPALAAA